MTDDPDEFLQTQTSRICSPGNVQGYRTSRTTAILTWDEPYATCNLCPDAVGYEVTGEGFSTLNIIRPPCEITGVDPAADLLVSVRAKAAGGVVSDVSHFIIRKDQTPPSRPEHLAVRDVGYFDATLTWDPSTDDVGVAGYRVFLEAGLIATVEETRYHAKLLNIDTPYVFKVRAVDTAGNLSPEAQIEFRTLKDVTPPEKPTGLMAINVSSQAAMLVWASPADDLRVTHNIIVQDGKDIATIERPVESSVDGYMAKGLTPGSTYRFAVVALDAAGNRSAASNPVSVQTPVLDPPQAIEVINITRQGFELKWSPPQNSVGISGYRTQIDNHAGSTREVHGPLRGVKFIGLRSASTYSVSICAHDVSDRYSEPATLEVTTLS
jgi:chitodextrinase